MKRKNLIHLFLIVAIIAAMQPPFTLAQTSCKVVNLRFQHPVTTHVGEIVKTSSMVTASCYHYDTVILDLVDSRSNMILSRVYWSFNPLSNPVSPLLVNSAIAQNRLGYWALSIQVYFAGSSTGIQFTILVEPHT